MAIVGVYDKIGNYSGLTVFLYEYRQGVIDIWKEQPGKSGLTNEQAFTEILANVARDQDYAVIDEVDAPSVYEMPGISFNYSTEIFTLDSAAIEANGDAIISAYLEGLSASNISSEPDADLVDNYLTNQQIKDLKINQLVKRFDYAEGLHTVAKPSSPVDFYQAIRIAATEWLSIAVPTLTDLDDRPEFKEFVKSDNDTATPTVINATDSANRILADSDPLFSYTFAVCGFYWKMKRDIEAIVVTDIGAKAALLSFDTSDIISFALTKL